MVVSIPIPINGRGQEQGAGGPVAVAVTAATAEGEREASDRVMKVKTDHTDDAGRCLPSSESTLSSGLQLQLTQHDRNGVHFQQFYTPRSKSRSGRGSMNVKRLATTPTTSRPYSVTSSSTSSPSLMTTTSATSVSFFSPKITRRGGGASSPTSYIDHYQHDHRYDDHHDDDHPGMDAQDGTPMLTPEQQQQESSSTTTITPRTFGRYNATGTPRSITTTNSRLLRKYWDKMNSEQWHNQHHQQQQKQQHDHYHDDAHVNDDAHHHACTTPDLVQTGRRHSQGRRLLDSGARRVVMTSTTSTPTTVPAASSSTSRSVLSRALSSTEGRNVRTGRLNLLMSPPVRILDTSSQRRRRNMIPTVVISHDDNDNDFDDQDDDEEQDEEQQQQPKELHRNHVVVEDDDPATVLPAGHDSVDDDDHDDENKNDNGDDEKEGVHVVVAAAATAAAADRPFHITSPFERVLNNDDDDDDDDDDQYEYSYNVADQTLHDVNNNNSVQVRRDNEAPTDKDKENISVSNDDIVIPPLTPLLRSSRKTIPIERRSETTTKDNTVTSSSNHVVHPGGFTNTSSRRVSPTAVESLRSRRQNIERRLFELSKITPPPPSSSTPTPPPGTDQCRYDTPNSRLSLESLWEQHYHRPEHHRQPNSNDNTYSTQVYTSLSTPDFKKMMTTQEGRYDVMNPVAKQLERLAVADHHDDDDDIESSLPSPPRQFLAGQQVQVQHLDGDDSQYPRRPRTRSMTSAATKSWTQPSFPRPIAKRTTIPVRMCDGGGGSSSGSISN